MQTFEVEIKEVYRCIASVQAESEEEALKITKALYESGAIELDSEDISETQYMVVGGI